MKLVEVVEVDVDVDMDIAVDAVVVGTIVNHPIMKTHSPTVEHLPAKVLLKMVMEISLKGVAMVDLVALTVVVAAVVSEMGKSVTGNALAGYLNVVAELGAGKY